MKSIVGRLGPDIPALIVIWLLLMQWAPWAAEAPVRIVFLGW